MFFEQSNGLLKLFLFLKLRDEKAQLNRRVDRLSEGLLNRTAQLEELSSRLKEFEEGRQAVERRLEAAKHQLEVQEALGPQVLECSDQKHKPSSWSKIKNIN